MAPIRYSLHYEDYSEHLMSRFGKLLQMQSLVDMTLMCSSHTLRVHKAVLAASSAYFQEVLQKQTGEPLIILKMTFSVLKCLVEFMYCGKTQCLEENLDELVSAAQFLKIKGLSKVTKEGLGIENHSELPVFTPPVVISRPPQSLIDLHSQDTVDSKTLPQITNINQHSDTRTNKDTAVRIPFDIERGNTGIDYSDPSREIRPRRGRPSFKRSNTWESGNTLGRVAERALLHREQDSRKAIHHLKHLQTKHMQDYMDRVTLSEAVSSICNNDSSSSYLNMDNDLMFMDQSISSNPLDPIPYSKDSLGSDTMTSSYSTAPINTTSETSSNEINTAMSQYINALKNAGLPTDLPILFESGDGSYINVNEQVLLDMVQSNEIQYEVIEQPNIIEKVADPSEIKSIDELSRSIERGEILGSKNYLPNSTFHKSNNIHEETINSLNEILPDNLEPFDTPQNYVVLNNSLQNTNNAMDQDGTHDFSHIDSDMQFFTKSMSDDVKKYYEEQQLSENRTLDQFCPSTSLDTSFSMSLLDTKSHYNTDDLKRNDTYDFSLQLPNPNDFREGTLDCLMSTPKHTRSQDNYMEQNIENSIQEHDEIMKDLMNIENKIMENCDGDVEEINEKSKSKDIEKLNSEFDDMEKDHNSNNNFDTASSSNDLQWDFDNLQSSSKIVDNSNPDTILNTPKSKPAESMVSLNEPINLDTEKWDALDQDFVNKENYSPNSQNIVRSTLDEDIPFAVGLLPLKQVQADNSLIKKKSTYNINTLNEVNTKYSKRKNKSKKSEC